MIPPPNDPSSPAAGDPSSDGNPSVSFHEPETHSDPAPVIARTRSAEEEREQADWDAIAATPEFQALLRRKAAFILLGSCFFLAYYFALPVLVGWFPEWMKRPLGPINLAYAFALSQFAMAWILAAIYVKVAARWDEAADAIISKTRKG